MAANHKVTLTQQQREILVSMAGQNFVAVDKHGNDIRISINEWQKGNMHRLYINFEIRSRTSGGWKNDEKVYLDMNVASDLEFIFNGNSNWMILEAALNAEIEARQPVEAPVEEVAEIEMSVAVISSDIIVDFEIALEEASAEFDAYLNEIGTSIGASGKEVNDAFWNWRNAIIESVFVARRQDRWSPSEWAMVGEQFPMWEMFYDVIIPAVAAGELELSEIPATIEIFV
jgi:hypothetical protein